MRASRWTELGVARLGDYLSEPARADTGFYVEGGGGGGGGGGAYWGAEVGGLSGIGYILIVQSASQSIVDNKINKNKNKNKNKNT